MSSTHQKLKNKELKGSNRETKKQAKVQKVVETDALEKSDESGSFNDSNHKIFKQKLSNIPSRLELKDGTILEGIFQEPDLLTKGKKTLKDGTTLEGNFVNNLLCGQGKKITPDGTQYEGNFVNNLLCGQGKKITPDGTQYEGNFHNDFLDGLGRKIVKNGDEVYSGMFKNDKLNGKGTHRYEYFLGNYYNTQNEKYYERVLHKGDFKDDFLDGEGESLTFSVCKTFSTKISKMSTKDSKKTEETVNEKMYLSYKMKGTFKRGSLFGEGYSESCNHSMKGNFVNGALNGLGSITTYSTKFSDVISSDYSKVENLRYSNYYHINVWRNSTMIASEETGMFVNGTLNGKGKKVSDGLIWKGCFKNGYLDGKGMHINKKEKMEGVFASGSLVQGKVEILNPDGPSIGQSDNDSDHIYVKYTHFTKNKKGVKVGTIFQGTFEKINLLKGFGIVTIPGDGEYEGEFSEGKMIGEFKKLK